MRARLKWLKDRNLRELGIVLLSCVAGVKGNCHEWDWLCIDDSWLWLVGEVCGEVVGEQRQIYWAIFQS